MRSILLVVPIAAAAFLGIPPSAPTGEIRTIETVEILEAGIPVGASSLVRTQQSAEFRINTTMLQPDSAYTVWVAAFNEPDNCVGGCDEPDLLLADGSLFFGTAFVTDSGGTANVEFEVLAGNLPEGTSNPAGHDRGINPGNGFDVELHVIIAAHGPSSDIADWAFELSSPGPPEQVALFK